MRLSHPLRNPRIRRAALYATAGAALVATLLAIPALALDQSLFERLFFEGGPIEIASTWGWIVLALLCLVTLRPLTLASVAGSLLCLAAAAREADWHKSFTGYSVMKLGYYFEGDRAIGARAVAFLAMALVVASTIVVVGAVIKRWREADQRPPKWGIAAGVSFAWLAATKVADRFRDVVGDWTGAGEAIRTPDIHVGNVTLYH